jgi:hypothetical protein
MLKKMIAYCQKVIAFFAITVYHPLNRIVTIRAGARYADCSCKNDLARKTGGHSSSGFLAHSDITLGL